MGLVGAVLLGRLYGCTPEDALLRTQVHKYAFFLHCFNEGGRGGQGIYGHTMRLESGDDV